MACQKARAGRSQARSALVIAFLARFMDPTIWFPPTAVLLVKHFGRSQTPIEGTCQWLGACANVRHSKTGNNLLEPKINNLESCAVCSDNLIRGVYLTLGLAFTAGRPGKHIPGGGGWWKSNDDDNRAVQSRRFTRDSRCRSK